MNLKLLRLGASWRRAVDMCRVRSQNEQTQNLTIIQTAKQHHNITFKMISVHNLGTGTQGSKTPDAEGKKP